MENKNLGPTVFEAAQGRANKIAQQIVELERERHECLVRMVQQSSRTMLESERLATKAEPYQKVQLDDQATLEAKGKTWSGESI